MCKTNVSVNGVAEIDEGEGRKTILYEKFLRMNNNF